MPFSFIEPVNKINGIGQGKTCTIEYPQLKRIKTAIVELTVVKAALGAGQYSIPQPSDGIDLMQFKIGGNPNRTRKASELFGGAGLNAIIDLHMSGSVVYSQVGNATLSVVPVLLGSAQDLAQQALLTANTITTAVFELPILFAEPYRNSDTYADLMSLVTGFDDKTSLGVVTLELLQPTVANITSVNIAAWYEYDEVLAKAGSKVYLSKEYRQSVQYAAAGDIEVATQFVNKLGDVVQRVSLLTTADIISKVVVKQGSRVLRQYSNIGNQQFLLKNAYNQLGIVSNRFDIEFDLNGDPTSAPILDPTVPISIVATLATANDVTKNITVLSSVYGPRD